jgi:hypothetical protein
VLDDGKSWRGARCQYQGRECTRLLVPGPVSRVLAYDHWQRVWETGESHVTHPSSHLRLRGLGCAHLLLYKTLCMRSLRSSASSSKIARHCRATVSLVYCVRRCGVHTNVLSRSISGFSARNRLSITSSYCLYRVPAM